VATINNLPAQSVDPAASSLFPSSPLLSLPLPFIAFSVIE
jgi:hypothetical protein